MRKWFGLAGVCLSLGVLISCCVQKPQLKSEPELIFGSNGQGMRHYLLRIETGSKDSSFIQSVFIDSVKVDKEGYFRDGLWVWESFIPLDYRPDQEGMPQRAPHPKYGKMLRRSKAKIDLVFKKGKSTSFAIIPKRAEVLPP